MRKILFCFSGNKYHDSTRRIVEDGPKFGATDVWVVDDYWLRTCRPQHWADTQHLWSLPNAKGVNWFAFKPFVILDMLNRCRPDDLLLYVDADTYPVHDLGVCYDIVARDDRMVFKCVAQYHKWWCTSAAFQLSGIPVDSHGIPIEHERYYDAPVPHGCARFMGLKPTDENREFLNEWYRICLNRDATTFDLPPPEKYGPENPSLTQHRCEQAIMTNLILKRGWRMWREACQFGESVPDDRDIFPQLFHQDGQQSFGPNAFAPGSAYRNVHD